MDRYDKGFTLIELLVVLAVIGLLCAILLPVVANTKQKGRQTACASNLSQLGGALRMYVEDNDGSWVDGSNWSIWYYRNHSPTCPVVGTPQKLATENIIRGVPGYAYNERLADGEALENQPTPPRADSDINFPATTVAVSEARTSLLTLLGPDECAYLICNNFDKDQGYNRHDSGGNYLFCDGHVKWYPVGVVRYAVYLSGISKQEQELCEKGKAGCTNGVNDGTNPTFAVRSVGTPRK